jgi:energy-coupling factor transporter ATP-binding protein EcfA2
MSLLQLDRVSFAYGARPLVLRDVSLVLQPGESALVLGDNGSGKSTLGRLIGELLQPASGAITIGDQSGSGLPSRARPARTIYVSQVSYLQFFRATLADEIALAAKQAGHPAPENDVLGHFELPPLDTNPRDLTYPEMWRLQLLLLGSVFRPSVLFVDEIVAPGLPAQRRALEFTLAQRRNLGRATLLAYQRPINVRFDHTLAVEDRTLRGPIPH